MADSEWKYILINGSSKTVSVKNPKFEKGKLTSIEDLNPFNVIKGEDGVDIAPTLNDAETTKRNYYIDFFKKPFKNFAVLSGAGSSIDVGGKSMQDLWKKAEEKYSAEEFKEIREKVNFNSTNNDLEALLSQIDGFSKFNTNKKIKTTKKEYLIDDIKKEIFKIIKDECTITKPVKTTDFPHSKFLQKLLQRKQTNPRIKIFTLNYDLLFEYAATEVNSVIIDGFSFTYPRTFSGRFFDYDIVQREGSKLQAEDNFIQRVFHLHKLHGSLNWKKNKETGETIIEENTAEPLMVYPREAKYEDSYEQPFFEMMARFQRTLRINNDTLLVCIGYSFNDKHINAVIEEALNQNPSFRMVVISPMFDNDNKSDAFKVVFEIAQQSDRILIVSETFADFANHFPEIQTYETDPHTNYNLKADVRKDKPI